MAREPPVRVVMNPLDFNHERHVMLLMKNIPLEAFDDGEEVIKFGLIIQEVCLQLELSS